MSRPKVMGYTQCVLDPAAVDEGCDRRNNDFLSNIIQTAPNCL